MLSENVLNCILRFFVGLKLLFFEKMSLKNFLVPAIFGVAWIIIVILAYQKNGEYGAPRGLLYLQDQDEKKHLLGKNSKDNRSGIFGNSE